MTTYVKLMLGSYEFASRNRRETAAVASLGHSAAVSDVAATVGIEHDGPVIVYHRASFRVKIRTVRRAVILFDYLFRLPRQLRLFRARCLSCHDLIALTIGWLSTIGMPSSRRPHLVYDSHEYELGRNTLRPRSRVRRTAIKYWERFLIHRCAFAIAVNDSIADRIQTVHHLRRRPVVVRSTPMTWHLDLGLVQRRRDELTTALGVGSAHFLAMYHGGVVPGRGIETFLRALKHEPGVVAVILGNGQSHYMDQLRLLCAQLEIEDRVLFHPAVPIAELPSYVAAADVGMVLIQAVCESYYLSLPNKLFENVHALTPVIGSDYPEIRAVIEGFCIGLTVDPTDERVVAESLRRICTDSDLRDQFEANLPVAKEQLCWEVEQTTLRRAYAELLGDANDGT